MIWRGRLTVTLLARLAVLLAAVPHPPACAQALSAIRRWTPAGVMTSARSGACSALLHDGRLLISGGTNKKADLDTVELLNPDVTFAAVASMSRPRSHHTCVTLPDGRTLVMGGIGGGVSLAMAEAYNPANNEWTSVGMMAEARSEHTATLLSDGRVLVAGGQHSGVVSRTLEIFDPATNAFSPVTAKLSAPRTQHAAAALPNNRVLITGGSDGSEVMDTTDIYDAQTGQVTPAARLTAARAEHSATTLLDGRVLVVGGSASATTEIFDPNLQSFLQSAPMTKARAGHLAFLLPDNNQVLIVGGTSPGSPNLTASELYTPWTESFSPSASLSAARTGAFGGTMGRKGMLVVAGGSNVSGQRADAEALQFPTIRSDPFGESAIIKGTGWRPGDDIHLLLHDVVGHEPDIELTVVADAAGAISTGNYSTGIPVPGVLYYLTATGTDRQAQTTLPNMITLPDPRLPAVVILGINFALPLPYGQPVSYTAEITPANATGVITLSDGPTEIGSGTLFQGRWNFSVGLAAGSHIVTASYGGSSVYFPSVSNPIVQTVLKIPTVLTVAASVNPVTAGAPLTITANVDTVPSGAATPVGSVSLFNGVILLDTKPLNAAGQVSFVGNSFALGTNFLNFVYPGNTNFVGSAKPLTLTVNAAPITSTSTVLSLSPSSAVFGQNVSLTATVSPSAATGSITFNEGTTTLGTAALVAGVATLAKSLPVGAHSITAAYGGDSTRPASTSSAVTLIVNQASTTTSVVASANSVPQGQPITFTASVQPVAPGAGVPLGDIKILDGSADLVIGTLTNSVRQVLVSTSSLSLGPHVITASSNGDQNFKGSRASITINVTAPALLATTTSVTGAPNSAFYGQTVNLVAKVLPDTATGNVQFKDGTTTLDTALVKEGSATLAVSSLTPGTHSITGTYNGAPPFATSTSAPYQLTIVKAKTSLSLVASPNPATEDSSVNLVANLSVTAPGAGLPTGTLTLLNGSSILISKPAALLTSTPVIFAFTGTMMLTATYSGDSNFDGSSSTLTLPVNPPLTTTTITAATSAASVAFGQPLTFSANVAPLAATGTVTFKDGATSLSTKTLTGGKATFSGVQLGVGTHSITAVYSGNSTYGASTSPAFTQIITKPPTVTTLSASTTTPQYGQLTNVTVTVTPNPEVFAPEVVVLTVDGSAQPASTLTAGTAIVSLALSPGAHSIVATYAGSRSYGESTSAPLTVTAGRAPTRVTLSSTPNPSQPAETVVFVAAVGGQSPGIPPPIAAIVQFFDGAVNLGSGTTDAAGSATFSTAALAPGTHSITATFAGLNFLSAATSSVLMQTVLSPSKISTSTTLAAPASSVFGQPVIVTAIVNAATQSASQPTGSVQLLDGGNAVATAGLSGSTAQFSVNSLLVGSHSLTAVYAGDSTFNGSVSGNAPLNVGKASSTVSLASSPNPSALGQLITFIANVSNGIGSGSVQFLDGSAQLGSASLDSTGSAFFSLATLTAGAHNITAAYAGDSNLTASVSQVLTQTVTAQAKTSTSTLLTTSSNTSVFGQPLTLTAMVNSTSPSGPQPSGPVQLLAGGAVIATATLSGATAQFTVSSLLAGARNLTAVYSGDSAFNGSASPDISVSVAKAPAAFTVSSSVNPSAVGQPVNFTVTAIALIPGISPAGTIQFLDGGAVLGTSALSAGSASLRVTGLAQGAHQIQVNFNGDDNYIAGSATPLLQTVNATASNVASSPAITSVNTAGAGPDIAQNTFIEIKGINLAPTGTPPEGVIWSNAPEFASGRMPTQLNGVSVTVNGKPAYVYFYCSAATSAVCKSDQINVLTPLDATMGPVQIKVTSGATTSEPYNVTARAVAPSFLLFGGGKYAVATHADGSLVGPPALYPGLSTPAQPNETIVMYTVGFGLPATSLIDGSSTQSGALSTPPSITIGGEPAAVLFAGVISPGLYQFNVVIPNGAANGDNAITATYGGLVTPPGDLITVRR